MRNTRSVTSERNATAPPTEPPMIAPLLDGAAGGGVGVGVAEVEVEDSDVVVVVGWLVVVGFSVMGGPVATAPVPDNANEGTAVGAAVTA